MLKQSVLSAATLLILAASHAQAAPRAPGVCDANATAIVRGIVATTHGRTIAKEAQYTIDETKVGKNEVTLTVTAFGLNGEDSDTLLTYELVLRTWGDGAHCSTLESMKLVGEN